MLRCPHVPVQHHCLLWQRKGEDPAIRMHLPPVPIRHYKHLPRMQGDKCANMPGPALCPHASLSYVLHGGSQDAGSREQTHSCWNHSDGKSPNKHNLAETLRPGPVQSARCDAAKHPTEYWIQVESPLAGGRGGSCLQKDAEFMLLALAPGMR